MFGEFNGVFVPLNMATQTYQDLANYPDNKSIMNALTVTASHQQIWFHKPPGAILQRAATFRSISEGVRF
jgi:hypothetical protein